MRLAPQRTVPDASAINLDWLLRLRWGAILGQASVIGAAWLALGMELPWGWVGAVVGLEIASNAAMLWWRRRGGVPHGMTAYLMLLDIGFLTVLLVLSGGASNPFSFLYIVHIALAAVVLSTGWTWSLVVVSLGAYGSLFLLSEGGHTHHNHQAMTHHYEGMWVAFGVAAVFITYFVSRVARALAHREREIRDSRSRSERLASLAGLAAGAAHELSTPLSTIAVVAKELQRQVDLGREVAAEDAALIRTEVDRCRSILAEMASSAGQNLGESVQDIDVETLIRSATDVSALGIAVTQPNLRIAKEAQNVHLRVPVRAVERAIRNVVKNAIDASASQDEVSIDVSATHEACLIDVTDKGPGLSSEELERAREPFYTTKAPGEGMGLGLFVADTVLEGVGGDLHLESTPGRGTRARIVVPRQPVAGAA